jgi:hypothetical protein
MHVLGFACLCFTLSLSHTVANASSILSGWVFLDRFNDGVLAFANEPEPDFVIPNVEVKLFQLVNSQEVEIASALTNDEGFYSFSGLSAGTYFLRQTQPVQYVDGLDSLGTLRSLVGQPLPGNAFAGNVSPNAFTDIVLPNNVAGEMYNFGELGLMPGYVSKRYLLASAPPLPETDGNIIPEPTSLALGLGAACVGLFSRRRTRRSSSRR